MTTRTTNRHNKSRRGVGVIIGGVIVFGIILSTVLLFFLSVTDNQKAKTGFEIQAAQANQDKDSEDLTAIREEDLIENPPSSGTFYIDTIGKNEGSLPLVVTHTALYCVSASGCPSPNDPVIDTLTPPITLNSKDATTRVIGPVTDALEYKVDYITERGNIVSTTECLVDLATQVCVDTTGNPTGPYFEVFADPSLLVMQPATSAQSTITVKSYNGFNSPVTLTVTDQADFTESLSLSPVTPPADGTTTSVLTLTADSLATGTFYTFVVTGDDGTSTSSTQIGVSLISLGGSITEGIIQGTGSMQLDFKAFGVIYQQLGTRDGVDQRGWDAVVASKYSSVAGYPGFQLMTITESGGAQAVSTTEVVVIESARNLDQSAQDLTLTRFSGMNPSLGATQGPNNPLNFVCKEDKATKTLTAYNENTANKVLPTVPITAGLTVGWTEVYFCSQNPGAASPTWTPAGLKFANLTPLFLVARGDFADGSPYSQTIPYQAFTVGKGPGTSILNSCLLESNTNTACPAYGTNQGADANFRYFATEAELPRTVYIHLNTGPIFTNGIDVRWLYPDGTYQTLLGNQPTSVINGNGNIPVALPDITCQNAGTDEYHTIVFNDGRDASGDRYIYYMTFRVDC